MDITDPPQASPDNPPDAGPFDVLVVEDDGPASSARSIVVASLLSAMLGAAAVVGALYAIGELGAEVATADHRHPVPTLAVPVDSGDENVVARVAELATPSIVTVQVFDGLAEFGPVSSGSGVVMRSDGHIVTNEHVVAGARSLKVVFADGLTYPATLVGTDPLTDIAVVKVEATGLAPIPLASGTAAIGDIAIAVGNPLGLDGGPSVTSGVVSALDRALGTNALAAGSTLYGLLQTDAPITRGSSGGALLNETGELIGITTAIGVSDVGAEGLGFAIPTHLVAAIADELIEFGEVSHAFLGIQGQAAFVERSDGAEVPLGAEIRQLIDGSAIGGAGALMGDVIVAVDGEPVDSLVLLIAKLRSHRAGDDIIVTVNRNGTEIDFALVLDRHPSS